MDVQTGLCGEGQKLFLYGEVGDSERGDLWYLSIVPPHDASCIGVPDRGAGRAVAPPWIWETSKIRADGMGNSGIRGTEFF